MKKFLFSMALFVVAATMIGCSQQQKWNHEEKKALHDMLKEYRDMLYLQNLTDSEFVVFTNEVANDIELAYPVYTTFIEMPAVNDTVDMFVVTQIVDEINADAHNMRHLFPYRYLVAEGILPNNLTHAQQRDFYKCFAQKVNSYYISAVEFLQDVLTSTSNNSTITQMQQQCANELFGWVIEIDEVDIITE
ncbi:MAG: hypothetical protein J6B41_08450 [Alistipes sp.]|nr:hypothetical protein [Alistipes sp.]